MSHLTSQLATLTSSALTGSVVRTEGMTLAVADFPAPIGAFVNVERQSGASLRGEVIGFRDQLTLVYPFSSITGIRRGSRARLTHTSPHLRVGPALLGRVVDAHGKCIDFHNAPPLRDRVARRATSPPVMQRSEIDVPIVTGVRAMDALITCGRGQRIGIFSGAGVGKSILLGMMARHTNADVNVIGLVGERGREVSEFIRRDLGQQGLQKSVLVVATSDEPAILRAHAAHTATAIAEYFRDQGKKVLLLIDSITRFAAAQREIGLAAGEPPATRGYPPSVFAQLPQLVERAGNNQVGSITGYYSVLVEGDDLNEPVSDTMRGLLDGHVVLSRRLANQGHYPAVDVLESLSRLMTSIVPQEQQQAALVIRELLAAYRDHEDLISIGAYRSGSNRRVDVAISMRDEINQFLRQTPDQQCTLLSARDELVALAAKCNTQLNSVPPT